MLVQAEISIYPLGQSDLAPKIYEFLRVLERPGVDMEIGPMSSVVSGSSDVVFKAIQEGFELVGEACKSVMVIKVSSAPAHA